MEFPLWHRSPARECSRRGAPRRGRASGGTVCAWSGGAWQSREHKSRAASRISIRPAIIVNNFTLTSKTGYARCPLKQTRAPRSVWRSPWLLLAGTLLLSWAILGVGFRLMYDSVIPELFLLVVAGF